MKNVHIKEKHNTFMYDKLIIAIYFCFIQKFTKINTYMHKHVRKSRSDSCLVAAHLRTTMLTALGVTTVSLQPPADYHAHCTDLQHLILFKT